MANFTQRELKKAFIELLNERRLNDITVRDITDRCGVSRNCFYYNYQDLPSLIDEIIEDVAKEIINAHPTVGEIAECFEAVVDFACDKKRAIMHIYHSISREAFDTNLMLVCERFLQRYINKMFPKLSDKQSAILVSYYKCLCFGLITDWLNNDMSIEYAEQIREVFMLKRDVSQEITALLGEFAH